MHGCERIFVSADCCGKSIMTSIRDHIAYSSLLLRREPSGGCGSQDDLQDSQKNKKIVIGNPGFFGPAFAETTFAVQSSVWFAPWPCIWTECWQFHAIEALNVGTLGMHDCRSTPLVFCMSIRRPHAPPSWPNPERRGEKRMKMPHTVYKYNTTALHLLPLHPTW